MVQSAARKKTGLTQKFSRQLFHQPTFAEFFAGIGLMRVGLEAAGWKIAFANDIAEDKYEMYSHHFADSVDHFVLNDVHSVAARDVPSVTLATASFPCTDLSLAGKRKGLGGKQSSSFWGFIKILEDMGKRRPPVVLLENVVGFLTSRKGKDFQSALLALNRLGYSVDALVLDAERFVPQSRVRLFVIASIQNSTAKWNVCETRGFYESTLRPRALADFVFSHPDINWHIRDLPEPPERTLQLPHVLEKIDVCSDIWWSEKRTRYLKEQMSPKHSAQLQVMESKRKWSYATVFRRVRKGRSMAEIRCDGVAGCLRTPRGGSGRQILLKAGYGKVQARLLTPRECARLMGADDFRIDTTLNKALFGFGDAVCVPVVTWIANHHLTPLLRDLARDKKNSEPCARVL